jgi:hypothetical protein
LREEDKIKINFLSLEGSHGQAIAAWMQTTAGVLATEGTPATVDTQ